jgi:hypothetical protein
VAIPTDLSRWFLVYVITLFSDLLVGQRYMRHYRTVMNRVFRRTVKEVAMTCSKTVLLDMGE